MDFAFPGGVGGSEILVGFRKVPLEFSGESEYNKKRLAGVMELVDVTDSKSVGSDTVWVRVPPPAPN